MLDKSKTFNSDLTLNNNQTQNKVQKNSKIQNHDFKMKIAKNTAKQPENSETHISVQLQNTTEEEGGSRKRKTDLTYRTMTEHN